MKACLINFLLEEYKQVSLFEEISEKGVDLNNLAVNNLAIVLDLIGFPRDNSSEYDLNILNDLPHDSESGKNPDQDLFIRDWLYDKFYDLFNVLEKKQTIAVTDKGLILIESEDEALIRQKLAEYIDWLYVEFQNLDSN